MISYHVFSPGGNTTALVARFAGESERSKISTDIMKADPAIEQVGFLLKKNSGDYPFSLEMAGGEFCVNASRSAALWYARSTGVSSFEFRVSGFDLPLRARVDGADVFLKIPGSILRSFRPVQEGMLVDLSGIRFIVAVDPPKSYFPKDVFEKYSDPAIPALGFVMVEKNGKGLISIDPWIWVRKINSVVHETACGSGSIAACIALRGEERGSHFLVRQPTSSVYRVELNDAEDSVLVAGTVEYGGERNIGP